MEKLESIKYLQKKANLIRRDVIKMLGKSKAGHPGGSLSIAEILSVLYFHTLRISPENPSWEDRDRFVLSKGHGAPAWYAVLSERGFFSKDLLSHLDEVDSPLQAHPDMELVPGVDMSTGALGQGFSAAIGMALGAKLKKKSLRVYALLGDGELDEGQVWEAAMSASKFKLDNITTIVDYNRLQLAGRIKEVMPLSPLEEKWLSFGWYVIKIDGHSIEEIISSLEEAKKIKEKPTVVIAQTVKGKGVSFMEDKVEWHAKPISDEQVVMALKELEEKGV